MFPAPPYREHLSLMLSEVLDDIGVNERMVNKRRRVHHLRENMGKIALRLIDKDLVEIHYIGSVVEGTTTLGLHSDNDILYCVHDINVIQDHSEWELGKINYLMIQDENTTPGYCFLQLFQSDKPIPATEIPDKHFITDRKGRILYKNTLIKDMLEDADHLDGPSIATKGQYGDLDRDRVFAYPCKSWPQLASSWLERQGKGGWPSEKLRRNAASTCCSVVATGSKVSKYPELEWRISTTLAERCLMLHLNMTQLRCNVLMKMILKSFLNPQKEKYMSSYICKTVLLHCIENTELSIWKENNLLTCLIYCLKELHSCVQNDCCLHFIISENNLMAGHFTPEIKQVLLKNISDFIQSDIQCLFRIDIDDLGCRLQVKLNKVPKRAYNFLSSLEIHERLSLNDCGTLALHISAWHDTFLKHLQNKDIKTLQQVAENFLTLSMFGTEITLDSCKLLAPFLFTTYGSAMASSYIGGNKLLSQKAMAWLSFGLNSDVSSSRLKMASLFYSVGDMEEAEQILRQVEQQYHSNPLLTVCDCWLKPKPAATTEFARACYEQGENCTIKQMMSFCVKFIQKEINCVPHELQYEMFRSTQDDMIHRDPNYDLWMDWAVIDSLPFLYFLQYKIYGRLQRQQEQQQALNNLIETTVTDKILGHRETVLNILGQCMEQENRPQLALESYLLSLQQRRRNNVAIIHICRLLSGILVNQQNGSGQDTQVD
ncbi:uncharacterized protein LOC132719342 [Ruditapes philippinarum]|uniref:uncharacterized protein LOC132719342 n=1 Tax=Ruditapes philippinarum TaxID=129788 RepID=UPI00295AF172|nr:uncharacterized protein LOC132719342 [Ruditapes philippinarum]